MASLIKRIEARMMDPHLNENFNQRVNRPSKITDKDRQNYDLAHEIFQSYKKDKSK